jgi:hypothetical protein
MFLDLSKAFDTVHIDILLQKLDHLGFRGNSYDWLSSYLKGRKQYVNINGVSSALCNVDRGVPQGSTLGPLLFLLYMNDFHTASRKLNFIHFADDTTLFCSGSDIFNMQTLINNELLSVEEWLCANRLSLNISKTNFMFVSNRIIPGNIYISIGARPVDSTTSAKFLGIHIDNKLKFDILISKLCSKLSGTIGIMRRVSSIVPPNTIRNLYFSLLYPHLIYALPAWGSAGSTLINKVKTIVNRAVRLMPQSCIVNVYTFNNILKFDKLYSYIVLIQFYKILLSICQNYFNQIKKKSNIALSQYPIPI